MRVTVTGNSVKLRVSAMVDSKTALYEYRERIAQTS